MMTIPLRHNTPSRRPNRKTLVHYSSYRKTLKEDFDSRCGYCGSFDKIYKRSFAIDHFIPQNPDGFTHSLPPNDYYNLVYACGYCNSAKWNKWPTMDITKPNDGKTGFIDPVDPAYDILFHRDSTGNIKVSDSAHQLSNYIHTEIGFRNQVHSILWKLETVDKLITSLKISIKNSKRKGLQPQLDSLLNSYYELTSSLFL